MASVVLSTLLAVLATALPAWATISEVPDAGIWGTNGRVRTVLELKGIVYLGGTFTEAVSPNGTQTLSRQNLMAVDASTGQPTAWAPSANNIVLSLATDGANIFIGGRFSDLAKHIAKVSPSGTVLPFARSDGIVRAVAVHGGNVYIGGQFTTVNDVARANLAQLDTSGSLASWAPTTDGGVFGMAPFADGNLLIGGTFSHVNGIASGNAAELTPAGAFVPLVKPPTEKVLDVDASGSSGFLGVAGSGNEIIAYAESGTKLWRVGCNGDVQAITVANDQVIIGGHYGHCAGYQIPKLTAINMDGTIDQTWKPRPDSLHGVWALLGTTTKLYVGGDFTSIQGVSTPRYAQLPVT